MKTVIQSVTKWSVESTIEKKKEEDPTLRYSPLWMTKVRQVLNDNGPGQGL